MVKTIEISAKLYDKLKGLAGPLFDVPDVIERLAEGIEPFGPENVDEPASVAGEGSDVSGVGARAPRERGVVVDLEEVRIYADSVRDLYQQVLEALVTRGYMDRLDPFIPYRTSNQRHLIARKPLHPNDNPFWVPVQVGDYFIETHKDYKTAINQLTRFLSKGGLRFRYVGQVKVNAPGEVGGIQRRKTPPHSAR